MIRTITLVAGVFCAMAGIVALFSTWEPQSVADKAVLVAIGVLVLSFFLIRFGVKKQSRKT